MGKRKREDDDNEYVDFISGLQKDSSDGVGDNSYIYSLSRPFKRPKINPNVYTEPTVHYSHIHSDESIYREIQSLITNRRFVIDELTQVKNSVLEDAYYLKKKQKMKEYGGDVEEALLFHGTRESNLTSICKFNFDWRLTGINSGHKFGKGVNFSRNAAYASSYSDPNVFNKVMIVAKVLIGRVCRGHHDMTIPPKGFDTSAKGKEGIVLVKYEDNEFFPAFILRYHFRGKDRTKNCNNYRNNKQNWRNAKNHRRNYYYDSGYSSSYNSSNQNSHGSYGHQSNRNSNQYNHNSYDSGFYSDNYTSNQNSYENFNNGLLTNSNSSQYFNDSNECYNYLNRLVNQYYVNSLNSQPNNGFYSDNYANNQNSYEHFQNGLATNCNSSQYLNDNNESYNCLNHLINEYYQNGLNGQPRNSDYSYDGNYHNNYNYYSFN